MKNTLIIFIYILVLFGCEQNEIIVDNPELNLNFTEIKISTNISDRALNAVKFTSDQVGYIVGEGVVLKTTNGGWNWTKLIKDRLDDNINYQSLDFINDNKGYISRNKNLLETIDGGLIFNEVELGASNSNFIESLDFAEITDIIIKNDTSVIVSLNHYPNATQAYSYIFESIEDNWTRKSLGLQASGIYFLESIPQNLAVFAIGNRNHYLINNLNDISNIKIENKKFLDVKFLNSVAYAIAREHGGGALGRQSSDGNDEHYFLFSNDNGENWLNRECPDNNLNAFDFFNKNKGVVVGNNGRIFKTSNSGINWEKVALSTNSNINDVKFLSENEIIIIGENGLIDIINI